MHYRCKHVLCFSVILLGSFGFISDPAHAQATRTWVSGVGDDANPCSRTAPCKTFAGAISKTAPGGEISCLDPGGFGAVTITKAITISCPYTEGGVLAAGNGIVVNAGANDVVVLRGLDIYGVNPPTNGVRFIAGRALHIENSIIRRFNSTNSAGVSFAPSGTSRLYVTDTTITDNGNGTTGGGIIVQPTSNGTATVALLRVSLNNNANNGLRIDSSTAGVAGVFASVEDSQFAGNTNGVSVQSAINVATVVINDSTIVNNTGTGIISAGNGSSVAVGDSTISGNADGLLLSGGAVIKTFGNNRLGPNPNFDAPVIDNFTQPPLPPS